MIGTLVFVMTMMATHVAIADDCGASPEVIIGNDSFCKDIPSAGWFTQHGNLMFNWLGKNVLIPAKSIMIVELDGRIIEVRTSLTFGYKFTYKTREDAICTFQGIANGIKF